MKPTISIVMPVYQAADTIAASLESIINQSFTDWELLIMDDGCTDDTLNIVRRYNDPRIRIISCEHNFIETLNRGFREAKGTYVARMDADDMMHLDRLKIQHALMERNPDIDILGSWVEVFGEGINPYVSGGLFGYIQSPDLKLLHRNFLVRSTAFIRASFWKQQELSYQDYPYNEEYKLFVDAAFKSACFYIESQPLNFFRVSNSNRKNDVLLKEKSNLRIREYLIQELIRRDELCDMLQPLWNINCQLKERKRLSHENAFAFISSILEKRSNSVE